MAAQKPLHQLLQEDQEPFLLTNYIADRRFQLHKPSLSPARRSHLQVKKLHPVSVSHNFCFFSINNSPEVKSPIFEFKSPAATGRSPCNNKSPNSSSIFLHVPAKTASLLLEAAVRIQKQKQKQKQSSSSRSSNGFGLFGSLIKRITQRKKREICCGGGGDGSGSVSVKDIILRRRKEDEKMRFSSELETSSSSQSDGEEEEEFVTKLIDSNGISDFDSFDDLFCDSPFHFVLRRSPSSGHRTPVFSSPATSPNKGREKNEVQKEDEEEEEEEEDKEQNSPVSVLDPPFEDDDDGHDHHSQDDGFDLDYSYAFVQRAKHQLLQKLRRFEKLAELDPVELEKRMQEQEDENDDDFTDEDEDEQEQDIHDMIIQQLNQTSFGRTRKIPLDMKRLVSDLINEEEQSDITDRESMAKRVCKRFEGWKEVESNTIDMMVEEDFKKQVDEWKKYEEQVGEAALEIEVSIFKVLVEELSEELVALISSN
ncbi:uncharacterized protein [Euphorbia lathyris]|uniref:uncharacterized protein n=1 Tax=Euphorbia lathyris TaxID=212925 RepID=UPI0033137A09